MDVAESPPHDRDENNKSPAETGSKRAFFPDFESSWIAMEASQIGVWSWDPASNRVTWSRNMEAIHRRAEGSFESTFAAFENEIHPEDRAEVLTALQDMVRTRNPRRLQYRLPCERDSEERWIECNASVVVQDGAGLQVVSTCRDITDRARVHRELRIRASQQEAVARLGERALIEADLQKFFDEAVETVAKILDVEMVKILELVPGDAELLLRAGVGWHPGLVGAAHVTTNRESQAGFTLASGGPVILENLAAETRFSGPPLLHEHGVVSGLSTPIAGRDGRAYGVLAAHTARRRKFNEYDVSFLSAVANVMAGAIQRRQLDHRQELMIRELRHRSGNLFSQLLALFSQTARNSRTVEELVTKYEARVLALANAHRLITEGGWRSAALQELLNNLLAPFLDRISFSGPDVFLEPDPTFGLSMALHELATNAAKYGSLSQRPGRVEITWRVERTDRGLTLLLNWTERGGPEPKPRRRPGFGSKLITMVITRQLNGQVTQTFDPAGLQMTLTVPLTHERWPGTLPAAEAEAPSD
jgi:PAS domain S-box-containing protein